MRVRVATLVRIGWVNALVTVLLAISRAEFMPALVRCWALQHARWESAELRRHLHRIHPVPNPWRPR